MDMHKSYKKFRNDSSQVAAVRIAKSSIFFGFLITVPSLVSQFGDHCNTEYLCFFIFKAPRKKERFYLTGIMVHMAIQKLRNIAPCIY